jgi:hypothetical protein
MSLVRRHVLVVLAVLSVVTTACGSAGPAAVADPVGAVRAMLDRVAASDIEGAANLACANQRDAIKQKLDPAAGLTRSLPGVDPRALIAAFKFDVSGLALNQESVTGDEAKVNVSGTMKFSVDSEKLRAALAPVASTLPMDQATIEKTFAGLASNGIPVDESVRVVKENGVWHVCDEGFSIGG